MILHHSDDLSGTPWWSWLNATPGFVSRRVTPEEVFAADRRLQWERLMAEVDPRYRWMRDMPEDPEVN